MEIEWLILADSAQVVNGKLYMLGGGWNRITANAPFPLNRQMSIAVSISVPWHSTNEMHTVEIEIDDDDGNTLGKVNGNFEIGRPPGTPAGMDQRAQMAVNISLNLPKAGAYVAIARIDEDKEKERRFPFFVISGQLVKGRQVPGND